MVIAEHRMRLKENEKQDKYLDFARELKKLWNMKMTIMPILLYEALCFYVAQGRIHGAPNETLTHSCRFASQAC